MANGHITVQGQSLVVCASFRPPTHSLAKCSSTLIETVLLLEPVSTHRCEPPVRDTGCIPTSIFVSLNMLCVNSIELGS